MASSQSFYDEDLAYIHDEGFSQLGEDLAPGLLEILRPPNVQSETVVDLGCGGGRWAKHLVEAGYRVIGIDVSRSMIKLARQRVPAARFQVGSLWSCEIPRCRAITALGEVVCYRTQGEPGGNLSSFFAKAFTALEPGGVLIFDVAELGLDRHRDRTFAEGDDWACLVQYEYDSKRDRLTRQITSFRQVGAAFRRSREQHLVQLYDGSDVAEKLRQTGFRVRRVRKFGSHSLLAKRAGFIARKPQ